MFSFVQVSVGVYNLIKTNTSQYKFASKLRHLYGGSRDTISRKPVNRKVTQTEGIVLILPHLCVLYV